MKKRLMVLMAALILLLMVGNAGAIEESDVALIEPVVLEKLYICPHCGELITPVDFLEETIDDELQEEVVETDTDEVIFEEEIVEVRYGFTADDIYLLAQLLCGDKAKDGDGEYDIDFQPADKINYHEVGKVLCVVMNRQRDDRFPNTVRDVVLARNQFSVFPKNLYSTPSDRALHTVKEWCDAYDSFDGGTQIVPENHVFFSGNGYTNTTRAR